MKASSNILISMLCGLFLMNVGSSCEKKKEEDKTTQKTPINWWKYTTYIIYDEDGAESYKYEYSYDSEGRETGYKKYEDGDVVDEKKNYDYTGKLLTYVTTYITSTGETSTTKYKKIYLDDNWVRISSEITYAPDGTTEERKSEYTYDSEGRETGYSYYYEKELTEKHKDYVYDGTTVVYYVDKYSSGSVSSSVKHKKTYIDNNWIKFSSHIIYEADGTIEKSKTEYTYDSEGREKGYKYYSRGALVSVYRDYTYDGNTVTYYYDYYHGDKIGYTNKEKKIYFNN